MLSLTIPLRALDALHLATALDAEAATVVTFDPRLREAAASQGLFVVPAVSAEADRRVAVPELETTELRAASSMLKVCDIRVADMWPESA